MNISVEVNSDLLQEAQLHCGLKSKKDVTEEALKLFISMYKQSQVRKLRGRLKWFGSLDRMREN